MDMTATPETGPVDAPVSMESVLSEFETGANTEDAADAVVREMTEQSDEGDAKAPDDGEGKVEDADDETEESETETPEEPEQTEEPRYTVKVNGAEIEVPLSELQKGYSRTEDYKAKTMALADEKRTYQSTIAADFEQKLTQQIDAFVQFDPILKEGANIDWQGLAQADPTAYTQLKAAYDARIEAFGRAQATLQQVKAEQERQHAETLNQGIEATAEAIRAAAKIETPEAFGSYVNETVGALKEIGLSNDDLRGIMSNPAIGPAVLALVSDAQKYRKQEQARKDLPARKVVPAPQARPLKSDASDGSKTPRKRLSPLASRDQRVAHVIDQFFEG